MDVAYDHLQEESYPSRRATPTPNSDTTFTTDPSNPSNPTTSTPSDQQTPNLNTEFQQAFKAVQSSPWGARLGGWFSEARKQGESLYTEATKEATAAQEQASKNFAALQEQLAQRARGLSLGDQKGVETRVPGEEGVPEVATTPAAAQAGAESSREGAGEKPESLPADIVKEATSLVSSLRSTAAAKFKEIQKAEDAADEALLAFGSNVRNFLRDAVVITSPDDDKDVKGGSEVLFETQEAGTGKKVFHSSRFEAQLHAIHTREESFSKDPGEGDEWKDWLHGFDVEAKTGDIARDLEKYKELRTAMEGLVPERVEYGMFWARYYFLRTAVEEDERRRKEVLKATTTQAPEEDVRWDESDDEGEKKDATTPNAAQSTTTLNAPADNDLLKPKSPRRSHDHEENKSVADSDASYDIVSGATSRAPGSPKEDKKGIAENKKDDESDDDWE